MVAGDDRIAREALKTMGKSCGISPPFFEIGPKSYLYGQDVIDLALAADAASEKYDVDIIFTTPVVEIARVKAATKRIHVFAPHMDAIPVGRGLACVLPESVRSAGAGQKSISCCLNACQHMLPQACLIGRKAHFFNIRRLLCLLRPDTS